jgi:hypothetical protein
MADLNAWKLDDNASFYERKAEDDKVKWVTAFTAAITALGTALKGLGIIDASGLGHVSLAAAVFFIALTVGFLTKAWLRAATNNSIDAKAKDTRFAAWTALFALVFVGITPLATVLWPELGAGLWGRRLVLGYSFVSEQEDSNGTVTWDSLAVSVSGKIDPSESLLLVLSDATGVPDTTTSAQQDTLHQCGNRVLARWGVTASAGGEVDFKGGTSANNISQRDLCLRVFPSAGAFGREISHVAIPRRDVTASGDG